VCWLCTSGAPNGIRTRAAALKGRCPRPLDDGGCDGYRRREPSAPAVGDCPSIGDNRRARQSVADARPAAAKRPHRSGQTTAVHGPRRAWVSRPRPPCGPGRPQAAVALAGLLGACSPAPRCHRLDAAADRPDHPAQHHTGSCSYRRVPNAGQPRTPGHGARHRFTSAPPPNPRCRRRSPVSRRQQPLSRRRNQPTVPPNRTSR
jgi:hypothetical protein